MNDVGLGRCGCDGVAEAGGEPQPASAGYGGEIVAEAQVAVAVDNALCRPVDRQQPHLVAGRGERRAKAGHAVGRPGRLIIDRGDNLYDAQGGRVRGWRKGAD